jgi:metallophosphoesterase (TIGR00282 family)
MNILCLGDLVGRPGVTAIQAMLHSLCDEYSVDFVVANIENVAGGFGFNDSLYHQLRKWGVDAFTTGNHVYAQRDVIKVFDQYDHLVRPLNLPEVQPGAGVRVFTKKGKRIALINLLGQAFMHHLVTSPFTTMDRVLDTLEADIILVDFHAEATSEKQALGWYLANRVTAIWGTHTHVQTNDCRLLSPKTGYITDLGMCGAYDSVLGMDKDVSIRKFLTQMPDRYHPVEKPRELVIGGMVVSVNDDTHHIESIEAFNRVLPQ